MWSAAPDESIWIGLLRLTLRVPDSRGLKDKRKAVSRLKERVRARHGLAVAEVGHLEDRNRAVVAIVTVGNDARTVLSVLDRLRHELEHTAPALIETATVDIHRPGQEDFPDPSGGAWDSPPGYGSGHG